MPSTSQIDTITQLKALLKGEISAVESYDVAISALADGRIPAVTENHDCHARRVELIVAAIRANGGVPDVTSGVWGALAGAATKGAAVLGRAAVFAILIEGEERGLSDYRRLLRSGDPSIRQLIGTDLLPAQKQSLARLLQTDEAAGMARAHKPGSSA